MPITTALTLHMSIVYMHRYYVHTYIHTYIRRLCVLCMCVFVHTCIHVEEPSQRQAKQMAARSLLKRGRRLGIRLEGMYVDDTYIHMYIDIHIHMCIVVHARVYIYICTACLFTYVQKCTHTCVFFRVVPGVFFESCLSDLSPLLDYSPESLSGNKTRGCYKEP